MITQLSGVVVPDRVEEITGTWVALKAWGGRVFRVRQLLQRQGFGVFVPSTKVTRVYTRKTVEAEVPVYTSWLFAAMTDPSQSYDLRTTDYVLGIESVSDQQGLITHLLALQRIMDANEKMYADRFEKGRLVRVIRGQYEGIVGTIVERRGDHILQLTTECMQDCICISVDIADVVSI
jgi:transcription antitermination factor NusG